MYRCKKCGCKELECIINKTQWGLFCKKCGFWIKWLNKGERKFYTPVKITMEKGKRTQKSAIPVEEYREKYKKHLF